MEIFFTCFLGFLSALLVQYIYKYTETNTNKKILLKGIYQELFVAAEDIKNLNSDSFYISPIEKSFWDSAINSGNVALINKTVYYKSLLNVYAMIDAVNKWEELNSYVFFLSNKNLEKKNILSNAILKQRKELELEIAQVLSLIKKFK